MHRNIYKGVLRCVIMTQRKFIALKYTTFLRLRKNFKAQRGESAASYFERLSKYVEGLQ